MTKTKPRNNDDRYKTSSFGLLNILDPSLSKTNDDDVDDRTSVIDLPIEQSKSDLKRSTSMSNKKDRKNSEPISHERNFIEENIKLVRRTKSAPKGRRNRKTGKSNDDNDNVFSDQQHELLAVSPPVRAQSVTPSLARLKKNNNSNDSFRTKGNVDTSTFPFVRKPSSGKKKSKPPTKAKVNDLFNKFTDEARAVYGLPPIPPRRKKFDHHRANVSNNKEKVPEIIVNKDVVSSQQEIETKVEIDNPEGKENIGEDQQEVNTEEIYDEIIDKRKNEENLRSVGVATEEWPILMSTSTQTQNENEHEINKSLSTFGVQVPEVNQSEESITNKPVSSPSQTKPDAQFTDTSQKKYLDQHIENINNTPDILNEFPSFIHKTDTYTNVPKIWLDTKEKDMLNTSIHYVEPTTPIYELIDAVPSTSFQSNVQPYLQVRGRAKNEYQERETAFSENPYYGYADSNGSIADNEESSSSDESLLSPHVMESRDLNVIDGASTPPPGFCNVKTKRNKVNPVLYGNQEYNRKMQQGQSTKYRKDDCFRRRRKCCWVAILTTSIIIGILLATTIYLTYKALSGKASKTLIIPVNASLISTPSTKKLPVLLTTFKASISSTPYNQQSSSFEIQSKKSSTYFKTSTTIINSALPGSTLKTWIIPMSTSIISASIISNSNAGSTQRTSVLTTTTFSQKQTKSLFTSSEINPSVSSSYITSFSTVTNGGWCKKDAENILRLKTKKIGQPQWNCNDKKCLLKCLQSGYTTFSAEAYCNNKTARYEDSWADCVLVNPCSQDSCPNDHSKCVSNVPTTFTCECERGYAGNGTICGIDSDLDGFPDIDLPCFESTCSKDNCLNEPNVDQLDTDKDGVGDLCDDDIDNDGILNKHDNCVKVKNKEQKDIDKDGVGDKCDNCKFVHNTDQLDIDSNGIGYACDNDDDRDGIVNSNDNCPKVFNADQKNQEGDNYGDVCDNCKNTENNDQMDVDDNLIGDVCQLNKKDSDFDSVFDDQDNCINQPNGDQSDIDSDGIGDVCDDDIDGDLFVNNVDNCPYLHNKKQTDKNLNGIGDACELDTDGDGITDNLDDFPLDRRYTRTDFKNSFQVNFDRKPSIQYADNNVVADDTDWFVRNKKNVIKRNGSSPSLLLLKSVYSDLIYTGLLCIAQTNETKNDGHVGFVFGYQSNKAFYLLSWRRSTVIKVAEISKEKKTLDVAEISKEKKIDVSRLGISLKKIESKSGPGKELKDALWKTVSTIDQSQTLWFDKSYKWEYNTLYQWKIQHYPSSGFIKIQVFLPNSTKPLISSDEIYDETYKGGRVGVFTYNQNNVMFSNMRAVSAKRENFGVKLDGKVDGSELSFNQLNKFITKNQSFLIVARMKVNGVAKINCKMQNNSMTFTTDNKPSFYPFKQVRNDEGDWSIARSLNYSFFPPQAKSGDFAFVDISTATPGSRHQLISDWFQLSGRLCNRLNIDYCINKAGSDAAGNLMVEIQTIHSNWEMLWRNDTVMGIFWTRTKIPLKKYSNQVARLRITATRGTENRTIIAIDNLQFQFQSRCKPGPLCTANKYYLLGSKMRIGPEVTLSNNILTLSQNGKQYTVNLTKPFPYGKFTTIMYGYDTNSGEVILGVDDFHSKFKVDTRPNLNDTFYVGQISKKFKTAIIVDEVHIWNNFTDGLAYKDVKVDSSFSSLTGLFRLNSGNGSLIKNDILTKPNGSGHNLMWVTLPDEE